MSFMEYLKVFRLNFVNFPLRFNLEPSSCPPTHPWVFASGRLCCSGYVNLTNRTKTLDFSDPVAACAENTTRIHCRTAKEFPEELEGKGEKEQY